MSSGPAQKLSPFAGFGIGVGFGFGCGLGVGTGIGGEGPVVPYGTVRTVDGVEVASTPATMSRAYFLRQARLLLRDAGRPGAPAPPARRINLVQTYAVKFVWKKPAERSVFLAGAFNNWGLPVAMTRRVGGKGGVCDVWETVLRLSAGTYAYKYVVDGEWQLDTDTLSTIVPSHGLANQLIVEPVDQGSRADAQHVDGLGDPDDLRE